MSARNVTEKVMRQGDLSENSEKESLVEARRRPGVLLGAVGRAEGTHDAKVRIVLEKAW